MYPAIAVRDVAHFVRHSWLGLAYGAILVATYFVMTTLPPVQLDRLSEVISTNMHNMEHYPFMVLVSSAMVVDGSLIVWGTLAVVSLIMLQRWIGAGWALLFALLGNAIPTLITMATVSYGLSVGWYEPSIRHTDDFGVSYVVATLLGMLFWRITSRKWRTVYVAAGILWLATMGLFQIPTDFTGLGHVCGYLIGLGFGAIAAKYLARPSVSTTIAEAPEADHDGERLFGVRDYQDA